MCVVRGGDERWLYSSFSLLTDIASSERELLIKNISDTLLRRGRNKPLGMLRPERSSVLAGGWGWGLDFYFTLAPKSLLISAPSTTAAGGRLGYTGASCKARGFGLEEWQISAPAALEFRC